MTQTASLFLLLSLAAPPAPDAALRPEEAALLERARDLDRRLLTIDTHVDTPYHALEHAPWSFDELHESGHADLPRLEEAGLDSPFLVVYTPSELAPDDAVLHALRVLDLIHGWADASPARIEVTATPGAVRRAHAAGRIAASIGMENGSPIPPGRLDLLRVYRRLGVGYLGLCHFKTNHLCDSATDAPQHGGLSAFGVEVARECNRLGILLDVSHTSDDTVRDLLEVSRAPIIASHSNARARCDHTRNLPDELIRAIAAKGGVVQLNFASGYVSETYRRADLPRKLWYEEESRRIEQAHAGDADRIRAEKKKLREQKPAPAAPPLDDWFEQVDHVVAVAGIDHVGLGSDFDGVDYVPSGIRDVRSLAAVTAGFLRRGWSERDLAKFYGENLLRTWDEALAAARLTPSLRP